MVPGPGLPGFSAMADSRLWQPWLSLFLQLRAEGDWTFLWHPSHPQLPARFRPLQMWRGSCFYLGPCCPGPRSPFLYIFTCAPYRCTCQTGVTVPLRCGEQGTEVPEGTGALSDDT